MFDANYPEGTKRVLIVKGELPILETTIKYLYSRLVQWSLSI